MAIDPELLPFLAGPDTANMDEIELSRAIDAALLAETQAVRSTPPVGLSVHDEIANSGPDEVRVRIYRRTNLPGMTGVLLFIHGGAFVFGNLESEHDRCLHYAQHGGVVVISVDYRLAPEFPYPAALNDAWAALHWVVQQAPRLDIDPSRICVGGASAGGSLAAGLVLRCRDHNGPRLRAQMLLYPVLDDKVATLSMEAFDVYDPWDGSRSRKMWPLYLGHHGEAESYAAPARESDLSGLPTTYLMTCEEDPLRDEGLAFALSLLDAGVSVELHHYRDTYHAFDVIAPGTTLSRLALDEHARFLERVVGAPSQ